MVEALILLPNRRCMTEVNFGWCGGGLEFARQFNVVKTRGYNCFYYLLFDGMVRRYLIIYVVNLLLLAKSASSTVQQIMSSVLHTAPHTYWQLLPTSPPRSLRL